MRKPLILLTLLAPLLAAAPEPGRKFALVVGINTYAGADLTDLAFAENDAVELAKVLRDECRFDRVVLLTSKARPTGAVLRLALAGLLKGTTKADTVLVALAGHGVQLEVRDPEGKGDPKRFSYFCASDTDLTRVSYRTGHSDTMLNLEHLFETLGRSNAGVRLVLMDACRNELKVKGTMRSLSDDGLTMPARVLAFLSCGKKQRAYESDERKHGLFFYHVLQGLRGKAKNGRGEITWASLTDHVAHEVPAEAKRLEREQTPTTISGEYEGVSPVLSRPGTPPRPRADDRLVTNSVGMRLAMIPAGRFQMGSPVDEKDRLPDERQRPVEVKRAFYLGAHEVTQKQFKLVTGYNPSHLSRDGEGRAGVEYPLHKPAGGKDRLDAAVDADELPVENVSWDEAKEFCDKLSALPVEKAAGRVYRLPTEAEWEYACRAGTSTPFHAGTALAKEDANVIHYVRRTTKVGTYPANAFGLHDMHGNVAEWCDDLYDPAGTGRVVRGGNWAFVAGYARSARRVGMPASFRSYTFGFRVAVTPAK
ncbi:MAG: SUMF1/EgtB/PvdO family nonheme iron enzyme [Gemmataceae bacterium]